MDDWPAPNDADTGPCDAVDVLVAHEARGPIAEVSAWATDELAEGGCPPVEHGLPA